MKNIPVYYWQSALFFLLLALCGGVSWGIGAWFDSSLVSWSAFFIILIAWGLLKNPFLAVGALLVGFPTLSGVAVAHWRDSALMGWVIALVVIIAMCALYSFWDRRRRGH